MVVRLQQICGLLSGRSDRLPAPGLRGGTHARLRADIGPGRRHVFPRVTILGWAAALPGADGVGIRRLEFVGKHQPALPQGAQRLRRPALHVWRGCGLFYHDAHVCSELEVGLGLN